VSSTVVVLSALIPIVLIVGLSLVAAIFLFRVVLELRRILTETRAMLAGFFPKHIDESLDKVPNDGKQSFVQVGEPWNETKLGSD